MNKVRFHSLLFLQTFFLKITWGFAANLVCQKYFEREVFGPAFSLQQDTTEAECCQLCSTTPNCTSYSWQKDTHGNCHLKNISQPKYAIRKLNGHWAGIMVDKRQHKGKTFWGLAYQPYQRNQVCSRSEVDIDNELAQLASTTDVLRLFAFDCANYIKTIVKLSPKHDLKLIIGLWITEHAAQYEGEKTKFENLLKENLDLKHVIAISVGTLTLHDGTMSESKLIERIEDIRNLTRQYGYKNIRISTVEVFSRYSANLMQHVDIVLASLEVFEVGCNVDVAVHLVRNQWQHLKHRALEFGKQVIVADSGWPSGGNSQIANMENHKLFHRSLKCMAKKENMDIVHFEAFDAAWKHMNEDHLDKNLGLGTADREFKSDMYEDFNCL